MGNGSSSGSGPDDQGFETILSIDGGGVRGIVPSVVLTALEAKLQGMKVRVDQVLMIKALKQSSALTGEE
uniref:PNPLA domain-containing protein n=1 Tax=Populus trichocarpa TaxID=3694 RepID=A0A3N7FEV3_POPTR